MTSLTSIPENLACDWIKRSVNGENYNYLGYKLSRQNTDNLRAMYPEYYLHAYSIFWIKVWYGLFIINVSLLFLNDTFHLNWLWPTLTSKSRLWSNKYYVVQWPFCPNYKKPTFLPNLQRSDKKIGRSQLQG